MTNGTKDEGIWKLDLTPSNASFTITSNGLLWRIIIIIIKQSTLHVKLHIYNDRACSNEMQCSGGVGSLHRSRRNLYCSPLALAIRRLNLLAGEAPVRPDPNSEQLLQKHGHLRSARSDMQRLNESQVLMDASLPPPTMV